MYNNQSATSGKAQDVSFVKSTPNGDPRVITAAIGDVEHLTERVWKVVAGLSGMADSLFGTNPEDETGVNAPRPTSRVDELHYVLGGLNAAVTALEAKAAVFEKL